MARGTRWKTVAKTLTLAARQAVRVQKVKWSRSEENQRAETTQLTDRGVGLRPAVPGLRRRGPGKPLRVGARPLRVVHVRGRRRLRLRRWRLRLFGGGGGGSQAESESSQEGGRRTTASEEQRLRDSIRRYGDSLRKLESMVVSEVTQEETVTGSTEVVRNQNYGHALTVIYYQILRHLKIETAVVGVRECLFVPFPIRPFTIPRAYRWRDIIRKGLRDQRMATAIEYLKDVVTNFASSEVPPGRRSDQPIKYIFGSLFLQLAIDRPKDKDDGSFEAVNWAVLHSFLGAPALAVYTRLKALAEAQRDAAFQRDEAPTIAANWVNTLGFQVGGSATPLPADFTLATRYQFNGVVRVDFTIPVPAGQTPVTRELMASIRIVATKDLPPGSVANMQSLTFTYETDTFQYAVSASQGVGDLVIVETGLHDTAGATIGTIPNAWERRDVRAEMTAAVYSLVEHLNEYVESTSNWSCGTWTVTGSSCSSTGSTSPAPTMSASPQSSSATRSPSSATLSSSGSRPAPSSASGRSDAAGPVQPLRRAGRCVRADARQPADRRAIRADRDGRVQRARGALRQHRLGLQRPGPRARHHRTRATGQPPRRAGQCRADNPADDHQPAERPGRSRAERLSGRIRGGAERQRVPRHGWPRRYPGERRSRVPDRGGAGLELRCAGRRPQARRRRQGRARHPDGRPEACDRTTGGRQEPRAAGRRAAACLEDPRRSARSDPCGAAPGPGPIACSLRCVRPAGQHDRGDNRGRDGPRLARLARRRRRRGRRRGHATSCHTPRRGGDLAAGGRPVPRQQLQGRTDQPCRLHEPEVAREGLRDPQEFPGLARRRPVPPLLPTRGRSGLIRGSYHFFANPNPSTDPTNPIPDGVWAGSVADQAGKVVALVKRLGPGDLAPALDLEDEDRGAAKLFPLDDGFLPNQPGYHYRRRPGRPAAEVTAGRQAVIADAQDFLDRLETALGRTPIIYTSVMWMDSDMIDNPNDLAAYPLWTVNHGRTAHLVDISVGGWGTTWDIVQYPEAGKNAFGMASYDEPGIGIGGCDFDAYRGTLAGLRGLADLGRPTATMTGTVSYVAHAEDDGTLHVRSAPTWDDHNLSVAELFGTLLDPDMLASDTDAFLYYRKGDHLMEARSRAGAPWREDTIDDGVVPFNNPRAAADGPSRYVSYWGVDDDWHLLTYNGGWAASGDVLTLAGIKTAAGGAASGQPVPYVSGGVVHMVGRVGADGHLLDVWQDGGTWHHDDLTELARASVPTMPAATYAPAVTSLNGTALVMFRGVRGELWAINRADNSAVNLTQATSGPLALGHPACFTIGASEPHVIYRGADRLVHDMWLQSSQWHVQQVCDETAAADPGAASDGTTATVAIRAVDNALRVARFDGTGWTCSSVPPMEGASQDLPEGGMIA